MAEYAKKTVAELQAILKERELPTSGKKAELIARLNENDKQTSAEVPAAPEPEPTATSEPTQPATIQPAETNSAAEAASSAVEPTTDPTSTAAEHPSPDTTLAAQTNYSLDLPTSTLDNELAKRKARAERFGTGVTTSTNEDAPATTATAELSTTEAETLRNLERAKRFGTGQTAIGKLDEALPSETARVSRKRGHAAVVDGTEMDDPGLKRSFVNRGRGRGGRVSGRPRGGGGGGGGKPAGAAAASKPQGVQKAAPAYTSEKDKLAAEARKKKFATA